MLRIRTCLLLVLPVLLMIACKGKPAAPEAVFVPEKVELSHAKGFSIELFGDYRRVVVYNPWQDEKVLAVYYLVDDELIATPDDGMRVQVPVKSLAISSVTHAGFLDALNAVDKVTGSCSPELLYNPSLRQKNQAGQITNLGDAFSINVERTMLLKPSALLMSGYKQDDPYAARVIQAGIPVIYNNEWMEETVLGRAEWIKFMAMLVGQEVLADSLFASIEQEYSALRDKAFKKLNWPSVMTGSNFRGTWYMPGGSNYMARMLLDAGGQYQYANDSTKGSLPLNVETVLANFSNTDVWLNCNFNSISDLLAADARHGLFLAVKSNKVYNYNKCLLPSGANDFWESAVVRPDWWLNDLVAILHPELLPGYELKYYQKLKK